jgi:hypothetical protein
VWFRAAFEIGQRLGHRNQSVKVTTAAEARALIVTKGTARDTGE